MADLSTPYIEGIYELQLPLAFLAVGTMGCLAGLNRGKARLLQQFNTLASYHFLEPGSYKYLYIYHHR